MTMLSNSEEKKLFHGKDKPSIIPHTVEPYGNNKLKLSFAEETIIFRSEKDLNEMKTHLISQLVDGEKPLSAEIEGISYQRLIKITLIDYVGEKIGKGWRKWRKIPQKYQHYLIIWCYSNKKSLEKARKEYEENGIVLSHDLTMGLLKREDITEYTEELGGKIEKTRIKKKGSWFTDLKERFKWDSNKIERVKQLYNIPVSHILKFEKKEEVGVLVLLGKNIGILIAPVKD
ncbi:MAG: hypothetical protein GWO20_08650 [Candidatus Korarchaeota archaeon]|nr:hypothetical protein [Candidatus Korarchaeota archaeon]NIW51826.1 hypothetical protein [Candidatus Korarchaeota archaeon]